MSVRVTDMHYKMLALRSEGWTEQQIADYFGYKKGSIHELFSKLARLNNLSVDRPSRAKQYYCNVCGVKTPGTLVRCPEHKRKAKTREQINRERKERYWSDPEFRRNVLAAANKWHAKKRAVDNPTTSPIR